TEKPTETTEKPTETTEKPTETTEKPTETTEKPTEPTELLYGDANLDGKVDIMDAILVNKTLVGVGKMEDAGRKNCDINADGTFDSDDGLNVLKLAFEILKQSDCPVK
ncbi:MAG: dockerin type I repeat-containing protein, partial [Oscillospiraceae bacterium]|nr:dockerin type I repeat-containing protein [Oscillospiraceae bacterium]